MESPALNGNVAIWLYGSMARGDARLSSDVDILLVDVGNVPAEVSESFADRRLSLSRYGWAEMSRMAAYGSLFLHHLKAEARPLIESPAVAGRLRRLLDDLPRYQRVQRDVRAFRQSLLDISAELPDPPDLAFEFATLAALIRRIGILGSYLLGKPRFDRVGPVEQVVDAWKLERGVSEEFAELYQHRLVADGGVAMTDTPGASVLALWVDRASRLLSGLEVQVDAARSL
jgi:hypothetical protein